MKIGLSNGYIIGVPGYIFSAHAINVHNSTLKHLISSFNDISIITAAAMFLYYYYYYFIIIVELYNTAKTIHGEDITS